jgi:hypothetical protein
MPSSSLPLTTDTTALELLIDVANVSAEITSRITARACEAISKPEQGPALRQVLADILAVLDASGDGVI